MSKPHSPSTLREMRDHFSQPITLGVLVTIAAILTLLAPFDTDRVLRPVPRLGFWLTHAVLTYGVGYGVHSASRRWFDDAKAPRVRQAASAIATGIGVTICVLLTNWAVLGYLPAAGERLTSIGTIFAITLLVSGLIGAIGRAVTDARAPGQVADAPPPLLDRLPLDKRGPLVSLSVEDHYVRIRTTQGEEMVLMRLADAMRETGTTQGLQVHRSHWVALDQVSAARREGDRAILSLRGGGDIPVSRRYVPAIKAAGLLPRPSSET